MERSYLIQRLLAPKNFIPIAFGGRSKENGGISDKVMAQLKSIWSFDYMGASEFEWGKVPEALEKISEQTDLVAGSVKLHYMYKEFTTDEILEGDRRAYYLCRKEEEEEVRIRLVLWAKTDSHNMKEYLGFNMGMAGVEKWDVVGWLEMDNGFMFFTDQKMWRKSCDWFGVKTPSKKKVSKG